MRVAIFGLGYVGFTAMCCLAKEGREVIGFDISEKKLARSTEESLRLRNLESMNC
ncbi:hypothetical protein [Rhizobium sp. 32-5/1]|uniref:hypothetical protein n=1 Tax=Rhizobium sp. 32-5/1 TaxID=3019602 RepID=UPI0032B8420C